MSGSNRSPSETHGMQQSTDPSHPRNIGHLRSNPIQQLNGRNRFVACSPIPDSNK